MTPLDRDEILSGPFANLVMQQTNMTLTLLGRVPHPETGRTVPEIEGARMFIDQLEMIEFKTRGNLDPMEDRLLKQSLATVRMAFVEVIDEVARNDTPVPSEGKSPDAAVAAAKSTPLDTAAEHRTKFSKSN